MIWHPQGRKRGFSPRRRALLVIVLILLGVVVWMQVTGAAGISGIATKDMDWNDDGKVTEKEILQAFYAVTVDKSEQGARQCSTYKWRSSKQVIRMECKTVLGASKE